MRTRRILSAVLAAAAFSASAAIPADLTARAASLRAPASPEVLRWVHEQGVAVAKKTGPVDVAAIESSAHATWNVLGAMEGADIEAMCFLVLMEAAKSAQEDLKAIMAGVKSINSEKARQRELLEKEQAAAARTPTPAPDRVGPLVAAARRVEGKTVGADLSKIVRR